MAKRSKKGDIDNQIVEQIAKNAKLSEGAIAENIGVSRNTVVAHLKALVQAGRVLPKGYYLKSPQAPRKIVKYLFIASQKDQHSRERLLEVLKANSARFPFVRVTSPFDYIAFVPVGTDGSEDEYLDELLRAGADTQTSVLTGRPPADSPELPTADVS